MAADVVEQACCQAGSMPIPLWIEYAVDLVQALALVAIDGVGQAQESARSFGHIVAKLQEG